MILTITIITVGIHGIIPIPVLDSTTVGAGTAGPGDPLVGPITVMAILTIITILPTTVHGDGVAILITQASTLLITGVIGVMSDILTGKITGTSHDVNTIQLLFMVGVPPERQLFPETRHPWRVLNQALLIQVLIAAVVVQYQVFPVGEDLHAKGLQRLPGKITERILNCAEIQRNQPIPEAATPAHLLHVIVVKVLLLMKAGRQHLEIMQCNQRLPPPAVQ
jgi:hypothetical protein